MRFVWLFCFLLLTKMKFNLHSSYLQRCNLLDEKTRRRSRPTVWQAEKAIFAWVRIAIATFAQFLFLFWCPTSSLTFLIISLVFSLFLQSCSGCFPSSVVDYQRLQVRQANRLNAESVWPGLPRTDLAYSPTWLQNAHLSCFPASPPYLRATDSWNRYLEVLFQCPTVSFLSCNFGLLLPFLNPSYRGALECRWLLADLFSGCICLPGQNV